MARRFRSANGLTPSENRSLGSFVYGVFLFLLVGLSVRIWGPNFFLNPGVDVFLFILSCLAYRFTGFFLRKIVRIWPH